MCANYASESDGLTEALEHLGVHDHLCLIYESQAEQLATALRFMRIGLERDEQCIYIADDNTVDVILNGMRAEGIEVDEALKAGALSVITKSDSYLKQGYFDPESMIQFLKESADAAKASGFKALRIAGEMTWVLGGDPGVDRLMEYETKLNFLFPQNDALAICQYNRNRFDPELLIKVIQTHPLVISGTTVCRNFYYVPPGDLLELKQRPARVKVQQMLESLVDRECAEHLLNEQYSTLRGIIDNSSAPIFSVDKLYRYTSFNKKHAAVMNALYGAKIQKGQSILDYMTVAEDRKTAKKNLDLALAGEQLVEEAYSGDELRSRQYFQVSHSPIRTETGEIIGVAVISQDMTERKQSEDRLRCSERNLREAQHLAELGSWELNLVNDGLSWSDEIYRIFEIDPSKFGASYEAFLDAIHPEDRAAVDKAYTDSVKNRKPYEITHRLLMKDGRIKYVNERCETYYDQNGKPLRSVGTVQDITERKLAEETLQRLNRELYAIRDCNQTLIRVQDEQTLLNEICRIIYDEAGYRMAWVGYAENDSAKTVRPVATAGIEDGYLETADITWADTVRGHGPTGTAIRSGKIVFIQDFTTDPTILPWRHSALQRGYRSSISIPLKDESGNTFGAISIYSTEPGAFTSDQRRLLEELAGDLAFGIIALRTRAERQRAEARLCQKDEEIRKAYSSVIDAVTGGKLVILTDEEIVRELGKPLTKEASITDIAGLAGARNAVAAAMKKSFANAQRLLDHSLVPFSEALTNAIKHASGGFYQLRQLDGTAQICIRDKGPGIDFKNLPKATLLPGFSTTGTLGMGFTIMLKESSRVLLSTHPGNTLVVLEVITN